MIAEGIQNPTTGEIVKVQGAGTVYNEEKNSIAIGKDTVASGQDQFVFGCKNALDVEKAEIVGGGRKIVLEGKIHISLYNDDKQRQARVVFAIPVDRENYDFSADTEVPTALKNFASFDNKMAHIAKIESIIIEDGLEELYDFFYIGGPNDYLDSSDNHKIGDFWYFVYAEKETPSMWTGDHFDPIRGYTKSYISGSTGKNIRTLDWNGHEYLAGSLAIGKYSVAGVEGQLAFGKGNIEDNTKAEIVGGKTTSDIDGEYKRVYWYDSDRGIHGFYLLKKVASDKDSFEQYVKNLYSVSTVTHNTSLNTPNWQNAKGVYKYMAAYTGNDYSDVIDYSSDNYRYDMLEADNKMISLLTGHSKGSESATCTWLSGRLTPTSIETLFNLRTLDWQGNQWNAGDVTCDDVLGNTISLRETHANVTETTTLIRKALLSEGGVVNEPINLNEYNNSNCLHYAVSVNGAESVAISDMFYTDNSDYSIVIFKNISSVNSGQTIFVEVFKADNKYILRVADVYQTPSGPTPH